MSVRHQSLGALPTARAAKDATVRVRMTPGMKASVAALADREGLTVSTYVRRVLAKKIRLDSSSATE